MPKTQNPKPKTQSLDDLDRAILNEIQSHFPIMSRPYAEMGARVGVRGVIYGITIFMKSCT